jgi:hypothetical protein
LTDYCSCKPAAGVLPVGQREARSFPERWRADPTVGLVFILPVQGHRRALEGQLDCCPLTLVGAAGWGGLPPTFLVVLPLSAWALSRSAGSRSSCLLIRLRHPHRLTSMPSLDGQVRYPRPGGPAHPPAIVLSVRSPGALRDCGCGIGPMANWWGIQTGRRRAWSNGRRRGNL